MPRRKGPSAGIDSAFIKDLNKFMNAANRSDNRFNKEIRKASADVAKDFARDVSANAPRPYARVWDAFLPTYDRAPGLKLDQTKVFRRSRATSRQTGKRRANSARMGDIFFGAEYGAGKYHQFRPWAGRRGYVFWPMVRANRGKIAENYLEAIDRVWNSLPGGK